MLLKDQWKQYWKSIPRNKIVDIAIISPVQQVSTKSFVPLLLHVVAIVAFGFFFNVIYLGNLSRLTLGPVHT